MSKNKDGFTLVELLVVAPIVILVIGGLIGAIIAMTGNVLATRGANLLAYNIQDALNRIETDVRQSGAVLTENNFDLVVPQGADSVSDTKFSVTETNFIPLILNSYATDKNPTSADRSIYNRDSGSPLMMNVVYFIDENNTLWRRVLAPDDYADQSNYPAPPWQQPSCKIVVGFCAAKDIRLVDGIDTTNTKIELFDPTNHATAIPDPTGILNVEVVVKITAKGSVAGRKFTESGTIRAISPNNYPSS